MNTEQLLVSAWDWRAAAVSAVIAVLAGFAFRRRLVRPVWLAAALVVFVVAEASPIAELANGYLFSAHMMQHLLLLLIAPAFLLLSLKAHDASPSKCSPLLNTSGCLMAWLAGVGAMWIWHAPMLCNAAVMSAEVHRVQSASLLIMGAMFWWPILGPRERQRLPPLIGIVYLFSACFACTLLGIFITFVPISVCSIYMQPVDRLGILPLIRQGWGITPALDQQLGGLLMWVPACSIYLCGAMTLLGRWYATAGSTAAQSERAA